MNVNEHGELIRRRSFATTAEGFQQAFQGIDEPIKATFEASFCWGIAANHQGSSAPSLLPV